MADELPAQRVLVEHTDVALGDRADAVLGILGRADLAHHQHIQRRPQRLRHLESDRHTAPRQPEHDRIHRRQPTHLLSEPAARIAAVKITRENAVEHRHCGSRSIR